MCGCNSWSDSCSAICRVHGYYTPSEASIRSFVKGNSLPIYKRIRRQQVTQACDDSCARCTLILAEPCTAASAWSRHFLPSQASLKSSSRLTSLRFVCSTNTFVGVAGSLTASNCCHEFLSLSPGFPSCATVCIVQAYAATFASISAITFASF